MRLFIAVNFSEEVKNQIEHIETKLKKVIEKGNFTIKDNLHLTLAFIGDTDRVTELKQCIDQVNEEAFVLVLKDLGAFRSGSGSLCWLGVDKSVKLNTVYNKLKKALEDFGFPVESREFKPHLTLARQALVKDGLSLRELSKEILAIEVQVDKISLMKSERINGKMKYTEIYKRELNKKG